MTARHDAGLTLVEMLVALAILSVIGVAGLTMLDTTINVQRKTEDRLERMQQIDRAMMVLRRDLMTGAAGLVELGDAGLVFQRDTSGERITIAVALEDDTLTRRVQRRTQTGATVPQSLLTGVRAAEWRLLDARRAWRSDWTEAAQRPRAAELTLRLDLPERGGRGAVSRLFVMPAGAAP